MPLKQGCREPRVLFSRAGLGAGFFETAQSTCVPEQSRRSPEQREIHQLDEVAVLHVGNDTALRATLGRALQFYVHQERTHFRILHSEHDHVGQSNEGAVDLSRVGNHGGSLSAGLDTKQICGTPALR